jgi:hypothetical protein
MGGENLEHIRQGLSASLRGSQGLFLALTFVIMIIIVLSTKELSSAMLLIGFITNFLIISSQLTLMGDRNTVNDSETKYNRYRRALGESPVMVTPLPGVVGNFVGGAPAEQYPGAIGPAEQYPGPIGPAEQYPGAIGPAEQYPGAIDFIESPAQNIKQAAGRDGACKSYSDDSGADDFVVSQTRSRNNPERVWAGIHRRKALIDRFAGEELDEEGGTPWWGSHET